MAIKKTSELFARISQLASLDTKGIAWTYLRKRGISEEVLTRYKDSFGYLDSASLDSLLSEMTDEFRRSDIVRSLSYHWSGPRYVFSVRNLYKEVIGIEISSLEHREYRKFFDEEKRKWQPFFWGLRQALRPMWQTERVYLFEGVVDTLSFLTCYPKHPALAILSKSVSSSQSKFLERFVTRISLGFDRGTSRQASSFAKAYSETFMVDRIEWKRHYGLDLRGLKDLNQVLSVYGVPLTRRFLSAQFPDINET